MFRNSSTNISFVEIRQIPNFHLLRETLASWAISVLRKSPVFYHGAGRFFSEDERQMVMDSVVAEFLESDSHETMPKLEQIIANLPPEESESAFRAALWNRAAQLVAQGCSAGDPEWSHARKRINQFLKTDSVSFGLVKLKAFGVAYLALEHNAVQRNLPTISREHLEQKYAVPEDCLKYGDGLGSFITAILEDLATLGEHRAWLSVDDLAFLLARAQEQITREPWMTETTPSLSDGTQAEIAKAFEQAKSAVLKWYDEQYASHKDYPAETLLVLRNTFCDHVRILMEDTGNHPGMAVLFSFHFPAFSPADYRNSSYRKDLEYILKRFKQELKQSAKAVLSG